MVTSRTSIWVPGTFEPNFIEIPSGCNPDHQRVGTKLLVSVVAGDGRV